MLVKFQWSYPIISTNYFMTYFYAHISTIVSGVLQPPIISLQRSEMGTPETPDIPTPVVLWRVVTLIT